MQPIQGVDYFYLFSATLFLVGFITPIMRKVAIKTNIVDFPNHSHKTHQDPVPYLGGVAIMIGILVVSYGGLIFTRRTVGEIWIASSLLVPAGILGFIGFLDDRRNLPPLPRFIAQSLAGLFTALFLIVNGKMGNPTGNHLLDVTLTVMWVVGITNAINFFDNLDGGAAGAVAATAFGSFIIANNNGQFLVAGLSTIILGAMIGFLVWNKSPARIYMGDAGSLFLGNIISVLVLLLDPSVENIAVSFSIPMLLLAVPILDTCTVVISRIIRRTSVFQGGQDHLSHILLKHGFKKKTAIYTLWLLCIAFSIISIITEITKWSLEISILASAFWVILLFIFLKFQFKKT